MPLQFLIPLIIIGLVLVIAAVHLSGGSAKAGTLDQATAKAKFLEDYHDDTVGHVIMDQHGSTAVLILENTTDIGLVRLIGQHSLTRRIPRDKLHLYIKEDGTLTLKFKDFTLPAQEFNVSKASAELLGSAMIEMKDQTT